MKVAPNFATLVVCRFFAGCFAGFLLNIIDGFIADMWEEESQRSLPITFFIFAYVAGVSFGPVYGAAVLSGLNWRWYGMSLLPAGRLS